MTVLPGGGYATEKPELHQLGFAGDFPLEVPYRLVQPQEVMARRRQYGVQELRRNTCRIGSARADTSSLRLRSRPRQAIPTDLG
jgi:hypothetical protein